MSTDNPGPWVGKGNDYRGIPALDAGPPPSIAVIGESAAPVLDSQQYEGRYEVIARDDLSLEAAETFEVLVFAPSGGVPGEGWLQAHARWHRRASNVVVIGPTSDPAASEVIRGSRLLLGNDEGFAALSPSNVSLRREAWLANRALDVIAGWHLWNDGYFFAYEPGASVSEEESHTRGDDDPIALEDAIPHRRFRRLPSAFHGTPKVSWVIGVVTTDEALAAWHTCQHSTFPDHEMVIHGPEEAVAAFAGVADANPRVTVVSGGNGSFARAVRAGRGELVAILHPGARLSAETVSKAVARFEAKPSAPVVRVGYDIDGGRYLRLDDLAAIDRELGREGLPMFSMVSRRELMKDPSALAEPATAWSATLDRCDQSLVVSPLVEINGPSPVEARAPGIAEVASVGVREAAREVVREARRRRAGTTPIDSLTDDETTPPRRVSVAYVGFTGHDNLGDEAVRVAIERLMPWADFQTDPADPKLLMVGGGTLINGRRYYLTRMLRQESASVERALFGTGVRSPEFWGVTEPMDDWFSFIDSSMFAAVRGPDSVRNLRALGYGQDLPIIGDPALYLQPPEDVEHVEGRLVVCPVFTSGNLHGGSDDVVFDALAELIARARSEGREVVMLSAFPQDDRWVIDIMRRASAPDLPYVAGYEDIDVTMGLLASAEVVVGERLHAAIMAAAAGTPFVGLEYRPKMRDFARSVGQEDAVIRTDEMDRLPEVFGRVVADRAAIIAGLDEQVSKYRNLQTRAAEEIRQRLTSEPS